MIHLFLFLYRLPKGVSVRYIVVIGFMRSSWETVHFSDTFYRQSDKEFLPSSNVLEPFESNKVERLLKDDLSSYQLSMCVFKCVLSLCVKVKHVA